MDLGGRSFKVADFERLPGPCNFIALMPQWDFLNFLLDQSRRFTALKTLLSTEVTGVAESSGRIVTINRTDYWQCAFVIGKGGVDRVHARGIDAFRSDIVDGAPFLADRVNELHSFADVKLLSVSVDRLNTNLHTTGG